MRKLLILLVSLAILGLAGCASTPDKPLTVQQMYAKAYRSLKSGNYAPAAQQFRDLQARYPFGDYAVQAHLDLIYALYLADKPDECAEEAERFIRENPRHPNVDYAYFMRGLAYFVKPGTLENLFGIDTAMKDVANAKQSFQYFQILVQSYPDSHYAADARQRMVFLRNYLAKHEMYVANYYMRRGAYIAATQRADYVLEHYQTSQSAPRAIWVLEQAYRKLKLDDLADDAARMLKANYPDWQYTPLPEGF